MESISLEFIYDEQTNNKKNQTTNIQRSKWHCVHLMDGGNTQKPFEWDILLKSIEKKNKVRAGFCDNLSYNKIFN